MFWVYVILWFALSLPNLAIFVWGKNRLAAAFGNDPTPIDGFDMTMALLLSPMGPLGPMIGLPMTDWWCSGFEDDREEAMAPPNQHPVLSRGKRLALRRAGWTPSEIAGYVDDEISS